MSSFTAVDLFAGVGGFALGLSRAGADPQSRAVELDPDCVETFRLNFPEAEVIESDVRDQDFRGWRADVVVGGPPCQGFSKLNRGRQGDPRNALSAEMMRAVRVIRPKFVVVENVPGFLSSPEGEGFIDFLKEADYKVRSGVVTATDFGVPQLRKRALVAASAGRYPVPWPRPTHAAGDGALPLHRTVGDAFALLPEEPHGLNWHSDPARDPSVHLERFLAVPEGGSRTDLPADLVLDCWKNATGHTDVLGRLEWQRPATTVRTEFFRAEKGRFLHPRANRPITAREAARLQSFPDSFRFPDHHTLTSVGRQIGNAMPPALAEAIGIAITESLAAGASRRKPRRLMA